MAIGVEMWLEWRPDGSARCVLGVAVEAKITSKETDMWLWYRMWGDDGI